jgi:excisionase family DNA binding protein
MAVGMKAAPVIASDTDAPSLRVLDRMLCEGGAGAAQLVAADGTAVRLPEAVHRAVRQVVHELAAGHAVTIAPVHAEVSTQQAADLLNVSRPFVVQLLESGTIPFHRVGSHRRVRLADVLDYRRKRSQGRRAALQEMALEAQEMGLYE